VLGKLPARFEIQEFRTAMDSLDKVLLSGPTAPRYLSLDLTEADYEIAA